MTAFFDEQERDISTMLSEGFLEDAIIAEGKLIRTIEKVLEIDNFPDDLHKEIEVGIFRYRMDKPRGREWAEAVKSSRLAQGFHSIFHKLAGRRIEMPFGAGRFSDKPDDILFRYEEARREYIERRREEGP